MKTSAQYLEWISRLFLALLFLSFGADKFFPFIPRPSIQPEAAHFFSAVVTTGYMIPLLGLVEMIGGALLLYGRTLPLGVVMLTPVVVNIVLYLTQLARNTPGRVLSVLLVASLLVLVVRYWRRFLPLIRTSDQRV